MPTTVRPPTIGVLSGEVSNGYSEPILSELSEAAEAAGVRLVSFVEAMAPEDISGRRPLATDLARSPRLDAVLVLPIGATLSPQDLARYCERFRPLPMCSVPDIAAEWCSRVYVDNEPGMRAVLRHLVGTHGYRRVGFVRGWAESDEAELRFRVYREVLAEHGLPFDPELVAPGHYVMQSGIDAVQLFLDERKLELDAIACANDATAFGVIEALLARGIDVPTEVAVVGFDDVDLARYYDPPLTTARQPLRDLGRTAEAASWIYGLTTIVGAAGSILCGWLSERWSARWTLLSVTIGLLASSLVLWFPVGLGAYYGWAVGYGVVNAGVVALLALVLRELFGAAQIGAERPIAV